jgi:hypothetical protein
MVLHSVLQMMLLVAQATFRLVWAIVFGAGFPSTFARMFARTL